MLYLEHCGRLRLPTDPRKCLSERLVDVGSRGDQVKKIRISGTALYALVDAEDFEKLTQFRWWLDRRRTTCYAYRQIVVNGRRRSVRMHQDVLKVRRGTEIDHINGDGLDNRKENLRAANRRTQTRNSRPQLDRNFKGVTYQRRLKLSPWQARICVQGRQLHLGYFSSAEDAARAYDRAARRYFKHAARVNFPTDPWELSKPHRAKPVGIPHRRRSAAARNRDKEGRFK